MSILSPQKKKKKKKKDFILGVVLKHLSLKVFNHSISFLLVDSSHSAWKFFSFFFFFAKISSFIKRGIGFWVLECIFVTELYIVS